MVEHEDLRSALAVLAESAQSGLAASSDAVADAVTLLARKAQLHALYQPQEWPEVAAIFLENSVFDSLFALVKRAPQLLPRALDVVSGLTSVSKEACASLVERGGIELLCDELRALGCRDDINTSGREQLSDEEAANIMRPESRTLLLCLVTCAFHVARTYSQSQPHFNELHMLELLTCVARATENASVCADAPEEAEALRVKSLLAMSYFDREMSAVPPERRVAALRYLHGVLDACLSTEQHEQRGTSALDLVRALGNYMNASEEKAARCVEFGAIALLERALTDGRSSEEEVLEVIQCVEVLALSDAFKAQLRSSNKLMQAIERFSQSTNERLKWVANIAREEVNESTLRVYNMEAVKRCATAKAKRPPPPQLQAARKSNSFTRTAKLAAVSSHWKLLTATEKAKRAAQTAAASEAGATTNGAQPQDVQSARKSSVARKASVPRQSPGTARRTSVISQSQQQRQTPQPQTATGQDIDPIVQIVREKSILAKVAREKSMAREKSVVKAAENSSGPRAGTGAETNQTDSGAEGKGGGGGPSASIGGPQEGDGEEGYGNDEDGHVLLSYQSDWTEQVSALRNALQATGVRCWMANFDMGQDVWGSMAFAVEGAAVVLICYSNSYKMSKYCRCEATYAMRINKPRIPLRFEPDYQADGWLGIQTTTELEYDLSTPARIPEVPQEEVEAGAAAAKKASDGAPERQRRVSTWTINPLHERKISRVPVAGNGGLERKVSRLPAQTQPPPPPPPQPPQQPPQQLPPAAGANSTAAATKSSKNSTKNASKTEASSITKQQIKKLAQQQVEASLEKAENNLLNGKGGGGSRDVEINLLRREGLKTEQIRVLTMNKVTLSTWKLLDDSDWRFMFPAVGERRLIQEAVKSAASKFEAPDRQKKTKT